MSRAVVRRIARRFQLWRLEARREKAFAKYLELGKTSVREKSERVERCIAEQLAEIERLDARIAGLAGRPKTGSAARKPEALRD